ncbi:hypothetical protein MHYP_G00120940 [Metynnis hypsauchen]
MERVAMDVLGPFSATDTGGNFKSTVMAEVCNLLGIRKSRTTPFHLQSNGLVEWFNQLTIQLLCYFLCETLAKRLHGM